MPQYQTVIYAKHSGQIISVHQNLYIKSKYHLAHLANAQHWANLGFLYFPYTLPIDTREHKVKPLTPGTPPSVVDQKNMPIDFEATIHTRAQELSTARACLVQFEGGMGDQLLQAAAVLTAQKQYPNCDFAIEAKTTYLPILQHVKGLPPVAPAYLAKQRAKFDITVSNHTKYISDPRGGRFGKASLYGAHLGVPQVTLIPSIKLTQPDYKTEHNFLTSLPLKNAQLNFLCQFRSGSGHAKSWQHQHVINLAQSLHDTYDSNFFVVGNRHDIPSHTPGIIDLAGKTTWWQTCLLISAMDLIICIDSGVMHLSRSLSIPYVCLWGGTNAQIILGEDEQKHDIRLDLPCRDFVCYECQTKTNACMYKITPELVSKNIALLLNYTR